MGNADGQAARAGRGRSSCLGCGFASKQRSRNSSVCFTAQIMGGLGRATGEPRQVPSMEGSPPPPPPKPTRFPSYSSDSEGSLLQGRRRLPGRNACRAARPPRSLSAEALLSARGLGARASSAQAVEFGQAAPSPLASRRSPGGARRLCILPARTRPTCNEDTHTHARARTHTRTLTRKRTRTH